MGSHAILSRPITTKGGSRVAEDNDEKIDVKIAVSDAMETRKNTKNTDERETVVSTQPNSKT